MMTYREFNEMWLNSDSLIARKCKANDQNCAYVENLIYKPQTTIEHISGSMNLHPEVTRHWDDEISELDKQYLSKKCHPKFIQSLNW